MPELTPQQLAARLDGMGSTDVVEVCGLAPWENSGPWRVYNAKLGITPPTDPTEDQRWGHVQERTIAAWYRENVGHFDAPAHSHHSVSIPWLIATLDGIVPDRNIEIKNVSGFMAKHWSVGDPDGVPHYVRAQVQIGMFVRGVPECHVVASLAGRPPELWTVQYDADLAALLVGTARAFWTEHVLPKIPPAIDATEACRDYMRAKYPKDERTMLEPGLADQVRIDNIAQTRATAAIERNRLDTVVREADAMLMAIVKGHAGVEGDGWKFTWKTQKTGKRATRFTVRGGRDDE